MSPVGPMMVSVVAAAVLLSIADTAFANNSRNIKYYRVPSTDLNQAKEQLQNSEHGGKPLQNSESAKAQLPNAEQGMSQEKTSNPRIIKSSTSLNTKISPSPEGCTTVIKQSTCLKECLIAKSIPQCATLVQGKATKQVEKQLQSNGSAQPKITYKHQMDWKELKMRRKILGIKVKNELSELDGAIKSKRPTGVVTDMQRSQIRDDIERLRSKAKDEVREAIEDRKLSESKAKSVFDELQLSGLTSKEAMLAIEIAQYPDQEMQEIREHIRAQEKRDEIVECVCSCVYLLLAVGTVSFILFFG